jgi:hypothetical protein
MNASAVGSIFRVEILKMQTLDFSETLVSVYQNASQQNPVP